MSKKESKPNQETPPAQPPKEVIKSHPTYG